MKIKTGIIFSLLLTLFLVFAGLNNAEARRFGGGGNFGGRSSYSAPYQRSAQPSRAPNQQQAAQPNQGAKPGFGMRNGLMGMLGGLAIGGLLGSMFMGGGFHGLNFLDILIFGGIAFMLYRMFAARAKSNAAAQQPVYGRTSDNNYQRNTNDLNNSQPSSDNNSTGFNTDLLFDKNKKSADISEPFSQNQDVGFSAAVIPKDFDEQGFLTGAKIAYKTLQKAWDDRDLAEIRGLTTDKVFAEIQDQINASPEANHTEILKLNAELLEVREIGNEIEAVVLFDNIMREDNDTQATQIREVWHFVKPKSGLQTKWLLDGIQQLAD
ncbi:MAG: TIM44-like domain-containing protein [Methyloglobulus sp.]|nr:Tim44 domain-containing protein [Methyloglobulus sp.]